MKPELSASTDKLANNSDEVKATFQSHDFPRLASRELDVLNELQTQVLLGTRSPELERARMRERQRTALAEFAVVHETLRTTSCPIHILRSHEASGPLPITFYFHGGGWTLGDLTTHMKLISELAIHSRSAVIFIEYPLAPEHPYPAPLEGCIQAIAEILPMAPSLGLDRERCGFVGDSSGGNLCVGYTLLAEQRNLWLPKTQVLLYPAVDASLSLPSQRLFAQNPNLGRYTMEWFWNNYVDAVVDTIAVRWLGTLHGFVVNETLSNSRSARACVRFVAQHLAAVYSEQR